MTFHQFKLGRFLICALLSVLHYGCGAVISAPPKHYGFPMGKILDGKPANHGGAEGHPYLVSIQFLRQRNEGESSYQPFCGGAILDRRTILTAGHCFETKPDCWVDDPGACYRIVAGKHDLTKDYQEGEQIQLVPTSAVNVHEDYDGFHFDNDIAIIHLGTPLRLSHYVQPIALINPNKTYSSTGIIAGWGMTLPDADPNILQETNVTIYSDEHCENQWGDDYHREGMLCAGNEISLDEEIDIVPDACWGDSGGPLVVKDVAHPARKYLTGIISWGYECGYKEYPGLYTKVAEYLDWIKDNRRRRRRRRWCAEHLAHDTT